MLNDSDEKEDPWVLPPQQLTGGSYQIHTSTNTTNGNYPVSLPSTNTPLNRLLNRSWIHSLPNQRKSLPERKRTEPAIGYRFFFARPDILGEVRLCSINQQLGHWDIGRPTRAMCKAGFLGGTLTTASTTGSFSSFAPAAKHDAPDEDCECGLWVLRSLEDVRRYSLGLVGRPDIRDYVVAAVTSWGIVIQHTNEGWRAQWAEPVAFLKTPFADQTVLDVLQKQYHAPVLEQKDLELYVKFWGKGEPLPAEEGNG